MNILKVTSLYLDNWGSPVAKCELDYDRNKVKEIFGTENLPYFNMYDVIGDIAKESGEFNSFRGKGFGQYDTKATYEVNLDLIKARLDKKERLDQYIKEIKELKDTEIFDRIGLKEKIIKVALGELNLHDIVGEYFYKNELKVAVIKEIDLKKMKIYSLIYDIFLEYEPASNYSLFNDSDRLEYKFSLLHKFGVITESEYEKYSKQKMHHDPDENRPGYFRCLECGTWQPISKRHEDGTCGC